MNRSAGGTKKPSICFVAPNNYAILSSRSDLGHIGGTEIQQPMIARELLRRGYKVSFVTLDHGQPDGVEHDGLRVFKAYVRDAGLPIVRFLYPRWTSLWRAMSRANGDIYYQMNAGGETGQVAAWCMVNRRPFVFAAASDSDCDAALPYLKSRRERMLYRYGLRRADRVIAQTRAQQVRFLDSMGIESILIRSCSMDRRGASGPVGKMPSAGMKRLLWVGRFAVEKRPEMLLDLAETCPEYQFDLVGAASGDTSVANALIDRAKQLRNVTLHGRVDHQEMGRYFERASLLLCTSAWEGYPNTFMEAWVYGVPTVSTVDPDDVISQSDLGAVAATVAGLRHAVKRLLEEPETYRKCSGNARAFYEENHKVTATVDAYDRLFCDLTARL